MAAKPVLALSVHQPFLPTGAAGRLVAGKVCGSDRIMAVVAEEGATTAIVNWLVAAVALTMLIASGFGVQVTPGGRVGHVTLMMPVNPPVGVTVIVEVPLLPAVTVAAVPEIMKLPLLVTVTLIAVAEDVA